MTVESPGPPPPPPRPLPHPSLPLWQVEYTWECPRKGSAFVRLDSGTFPLLLRERERRKERATKRLRIITRPPFHLRDPFPSVTPDCIDHPFLPGIYARKAVLHPFSFRFSGPEPFSPLSATEWSERAMGFPVKNFQEHLATRSSR